MVPPPRALIAVLAVAAFTACRQGPVPLDDAQRMAYAVKPGVVRINAYATATFSYPMQTIDDVGRVVDDRLSVVGQPITGNRQARTLSVDTGAGGSGSGFVVHPNGLILTNGHVVAPTRDPEALHKELLRNGAIAALVKHLPVERLRELYRNQELGSYIDIVAGVGAVTNIHVLNDAELSNGEKLPFRIERFSPPLNENGTDLALLRVDRKNLPVLTLGDSDQVRVGQTIWAAGYPVLASSTDEVIGGWLSPDSDLEATVVPGQITAIKRNRTNTPLFQSNVAIYRGNSGGPDVNLAGEVIGISTWGHSGAEAIKFLVPINVAKSFLGQAAVALNIESDFSKSYRAALDAAGHNDWTAAAAELARAGKQFPNSPDLIRFDRDVQRALKETPLWRKYRVALAALIVAAVVVVAAIAIPRSRRKRPPQDVLKATTETIVSPSSVPPGTPLMLGKFTILNGTRAGERLGLGGSGIRIGRESTICEIVLENPKVSRLHAEVVSIDGKVLLIDRNSSNGTYVNDQKIDKRFLKDGDIIYFGGRNAVAVAFHA